MKKQIKHITKKVFIVLLALQVLNLSTNSIDFQPIPTSNLTEFNDLNTITEYLTEIVFGHVNAFPECISKEQKQSQLQKHIAFKVFYPHEGLLTIQHVQNPILYGISVNEKYSYLFFREINPPPPKSFLA